MLAAEWGRRRSVILLLAAAAVLVPVIAYVGIVGNARDGSGDPVADLRLVGTVLAVWGVPLVWGGGAWKDEHRGGWVYALSLPVGRVRHFAYRYLAGLAWLLVPLAAMALCAYALAAFAQLPRGVYAYPGAFTAWACVTGWMLYSVMFVLGARFERPWMVVGGALVCMVLVNVALETGTFPLGARALELLLYGGASPMRALASGQLPFGY
jgi:hypothetical protein